jgi:hypothetical protein
VADLFEQDLLELQPGERLWKLYCFRDFVYKDTATTEIYTKEKEGGRLGLLTFAVHNPPREDGAKRDAPPIRSALARVPDLSGADLDKLIAAVRSQVGSAACEEVDLSHLGAIDGQLAWLRAQNGG